jgi:hypothetical protein
MKRLLLLFLVMGFTLILLSKDNRSIVAVMEFIDTTGTLSEEILENASQYMRASFVGSNRYVVISRERQQNEMVKVMRKESHQICRDRNCQIPLGQSLSADTILVSTISRFGGSYTLTVELIDLAKEATIRGAKSEFDGKEEGLKRAMDDVVSQVFGVRKVAVAQAAPSKSSAQDEQACNFAREESTVEMWNRYLREFPDGACIFEANIFFERTAEEELKRAEEEAERKKKAEKERKERIKNAFSNNHGKLQWSNPSFEEMSWNNAIEYCKELGGRLPTINELRMFIRNCPETEYPRPLSQDFWCEVTNECLSSKSCKSSACGGCPVDRSGKYSVFHRVGWFWSSSACLGSEHLAWCVYFDSGRVTNNYKADNHSVMCVR